MSCWAMNTKSSASRKKPWPPGNSASPNFQTTRRFRKKLADNDLFRQFFRRAGPDFRECWMIMRHGGEFTDGHPLRHRRDDFMDEFAAAGTNTAAAEDFTRLGMRQQFHETVL